MTSLQQSILLALLLTVAVFMGCSETLQPEEELASFELLENFSIIEDDLEVLNRNGIDVDLHDGVFSIGWNQFLGPISHDSGTSGHAFAIAFDKTRDFLPGMRFLRGGLDMGTINIYYGDQSLELPKIETRLGGTIYSLFQRRHTGPTVTMEYLPGEIYEFEIGGTDNFAPLNIALTAPESLLEITSPGEDQLISVSSDLVLTWDGGDAGEAIAIRMLPHHDRLPGHRPHPIDLPGIIFEVLDGNPGEYTLSAESLQELAVITDTNQFSLMVSQFDLQEVEHDGGIYHALMRNGDRIIVTLGD